MNRLEISSDQFRKLAERVTALSASYLDELDSLPVAPDTSGYEVLRLFHAPLPEQGLGEAALDILPEVVRLSRVQNARFFGYVLGSGEPVGAVGDLLASVINQNVTAWRSGPAAVTIEQTVVEWLSQAIGCPGFRGYLTGGGSSANLMGLAMAREAKMPGNEKGVTSGGVVYASDRSSHVDSQERGSSGHRARQYAPDSRGCLLPHDSRGIGAPNRARSTRRGRFRLRSLLRREQ